MVWLCSPVSVRRLVFGLVLLAVSESACTQRHTPDDSPASAKSVEAPVTASAGPPPTLVPYHGDLALQPLPAPPKPDRSTERTQPVSWWTDVGRAVRAATLPQPQPRVVCPFGHAEDYRWLSGELFYSAVRQTWCLHYADAEDTDSHGGCVTLVLPTTLATGLHGGHARAHGRLLNPSTRQPSPAYKVESIESLP